MTGPVARHRRKRLGVRLLVVAAVIALTGCSDDDSAPGSTSSSPTATHRDAAGTDDSTAVASPPDLERLDGALLGADDVGVPDGWAHPRPRRGDHGPGRGPRRRSLPGLPRLPGRRVAARGPWMQRTFTSPDQPLGDGILRIDVIAAVQDEAPTAEGQLAACIPTSPEATVDVEEVEVTPLAGEPPGPIGTGGRSDGGDPDRRTVGRCSVPEQLRAGDGQPGRADGHASLAGGVDLGVPFADSTRELVGRILARL